MGMEDEGEGRGEVKSEEEKGRCQGEGRGGRERGTPKGWFACSKS